METENVTYKAAIAETTKLISEPTTHKSTNLTQMLLLQS